MIRIFTNNRQKLQYFLYESSDDKMIYGPRSLNAQDFRLALIKACGKTFNKRRFDSIRNIRQADDFYPTKEYIFVDVESFLPENYNAIIDLIESKKDINITFFLEKKPLFVDPNFDQFITKINQFILVQQEK